MSDVRFSQATNAYQDALRAAQRILNGTGAGNPTEESHAASGPSFLDMVGHSLESAVNTGYKSEQVAAQSLSGKANMTDVVTAMAEAEASLNTVVAIRDRVINAYQDIIKMAI